MNNSENLTLQQQRFCDEYLVSFNAFRAAIAAGYSENTARKAELLHNPKIQAYLQLAMEKARQRLEITHDMILRELAKVAFSNMGNYYDDRGAIKPMCCMTSEEKAAVSYYQIMDSIDEHGNRVGEFAKIKLHNKMSALDKIARHVGFYSEKRVVSGELPVAGLEEEQTQESRGKNQDREQEAGSLKQEAFFESQESGCKNRAIASSSTPKQKMVDNQDEEGFVVNGDGELVAEASTDDLIMQADNTGALETPPAVAGKILTLSPLPREKRSKIQESGGKVYAVVSSRGAILLKNRELKGDVTVHL